MLISWYSMHMNYTAWDAKNLQQFFITENDKKTCVWLTPASDKPLIILIHGIGGDHAGLVPLAMELSGDYRVGIVDLPGHGKSDIIPLPDADALQHWCAQLVKSIGREIGPIAFICAHSFGCSAVLGKDVLTTQKIILINPVPTPSQAYARYSRIVMSSSRFLAHIYNWQPFILLRGRTIRKVHTREAIQRVRWVGLHSPSHYHQIVFQSGLVDMILDSSAYRNAKTGKIALVIASISDTTAAERGSLDMQNVFGDCKVAFLRGGHLLPIETPERVAYLINQVMVH